MTQVHHVVTHLHVSQKVQLDAMLPAEVKEYDRLLQLIGGGKSPKFMTGHEPLNNETFAQALRAGVILTQPYDPTHSASNHVTESILHCAQCHNTQRRIAT